MNLTENNNLQWSAEHRLGEFQIATSRGGARRFTILFE
jgi:hypothetical protein